MKEYEVFIEHINNNLMITDSMTKALQAKQYRDHMGSMTAMIHMLYS
jgi:hypothetical protein